MPSRVSQITRSLKQRIQYSDFTSNLDLNPVTGELAVLKNEASVVNSIMNLIFTYPTERFYQPTVGSTVSRSLFEFVDDFTSDQIADTIRYTINTFEPRAQNLQVVVHQVPNENYVKVDITFQLGNIPGQTFTIPTFNVGV